MHFHVSPYIFATSLAPVAQLDRASDYGSEGLGFDSLRVHNKGFSFLKPFLLYGTSMHRILVIIPAFNAHSTINGILSVLNQFKERSRPLDIDLDTLVVDDGSDPRLETHLNSGYGHIITHTLNKGKGAALKSGFKLASLEKYDYVVTMDADGQHDPNRLLEMVSFGLRGDYDLVIGERNISLKSMSLGRFLSNKITTKIICRMSGLDIKDSQCGFRFIKIDLLDKIELHTDNFDTESEFLLRASKYNIKFANYPIPTINNPSQSHINHLHDTVRFIRLLMKSI